MEAIKPSEDPSIGMLSEGERVQGGIERKEGSAADRYSWQPMMFAKDMRPCHREEITGVMHNTLFLNHTGNDTEDATVICER